MDTQLRFFKAEHFSSAHAFANAIYAASRLPQDQLVPKVRDVWADFQAFQSLLPGNNDLGLQRYFSAPSAEISDHFFKEILRTTSVDLLFGVTNGAIRALGFSLGLCVSEDENEFFKGHGPNKFLMHPAVCGFRGGVLSAGGVCFRDNHIYLQRDGDVLFADSSISERSHAIIENTSVGYFLRDNKSSQGTYVKMPTGNWLKLVPSQRVKLTHINFIRLGNAEFVFLEPRSPVGLGRVVTSAHVASDYPKVLVAV